MNNTRAVYSEVKKIQAPYSDSLSSECSPKVLLSGNEAGEHSQTLNDPDLFLSSKYPEVILSSPEQGTLPPGIILENSLLFLWT